MASPENPHYLELPHVVYGRLLESAHISGYSFERVCSELEWLLEEDRWQSVGPGYEDINEFVRSVDLSPFNMKGAPRQKLVRRLADLEASQRATAKMLGKSVGTVNRDLAVQNGTPDDNGRGADQDRPDAVVQNGTPPTRELLSQSDQNDWRTPRRFLDAARPVLGGRIDLDPASSSEANKTVKAARFYTDEDDGLTKPWKGRVWLNPPYGGQARLFIERLVREYEVGNVTAGCALLNSHPTETAWFQQLFRYSVCFIRGRIDFGGPSREVSSSSTHGSAIAYLGPDVPAFAAAFAEFGAVVTRV